MSPEAKSGRIQYLRQNVDKIAHPLRKRRESREERMTARNKRNDLLSAFGGEDGREVSLLQIRGLLDAEKELERLGASELSATELRHLEDVNLDTMAGLGHAAGFFVQRSVIFNFPRRAQEMLGIDFTHEGSVKKTRACFTAAELLGRERTRLFNQQYS